jgi:hypothetical protein
MKSLIKLIIIENTNYYMYISIRDGIYSILNILLYLILKDTILLRNFCTKSISFTRNITVYVINFDLKLHEI